MGIINTDIINYNEVLSTPDSDICIRLAKIINEYLTDADNKVWHGHPVWFLEGNPIVGYSKLKGGIKLMFWSGESFEDPYLNLGSGKFKDASIYYQQINEIDEERLINWLIKSKEIQWDYKNIVKRKGVLVRLK